MTDSPPRLSDEEIASHFDSLWAGDKSARQALSEGNMHWIRQLVTPLADESDLPIGDLLDAATAGLTSAIDAYSNHTHKFQPDSNLQGGYAIWWVRMAFMRLAKDRGYDYSAATNTIIPTP
jgi:hypothetical protein